MMTMLAEWGKESVFTAEHVSFSMVSIAIYPLLMTRWGSMLVFSGAVGGRDKFGVGGDAGGGGDSGRGESEEEIERAVVWGRGQCCGKA
jgi:hypothetical protein